MFANLKLFVVYIQMNHLKANKILRMGYCYNIRDTNMISGAVVCQAEG